MIWVWTLNPPSLMSLTILEYTEMNEDDKLAIMTTLTKKFNLMVGSSVVLSIVFVFLTCKLYKDLVNYPSLKI